MATQEQVDSIVKPVQKGLAELITGNPGLLLDRPGFINGGGPADPFSNTVRSLSQANCRIWAAADKENFSPRVNSGNAILCNPYLGSISELPPTGAIAPPFLGGQCEGDRYRLDYSIQPFNGNATSGSPSGRRGPISRRIINPSPGRWEVYQDYFSSTGLPLSSLVGGFNSQGGPPAILQWDLTNQDGPDSCGNPPADYTPPGQSAPIVPQPPNITVDFPGLGPVDVDITLGPTGDPTFCIEVVETCFTIDVGIEGDPTGGAGEPAGPDPRSPGEPGGSVDSGAGGEAEGEAPEGKELVGLLVTILVSPGNPNTFKNTSEQVFRGIGYVSMGYEGRLGVDPTAGVFRTPQFFHAQQPGLTHWRVSANIGFNLRAVPYYRDI